LEGTVDSDESGCNLLFDHLNLPDCNLPSRLVLSLLSTTSLAIETYSCTNKDGNASYHYQWPDKASQMFGPDSNPRLVRPRFPFWWPR
jgi:hypothetical protein